MVAGQRKEEGGCYGAMRDVGKRNLICAGWWYDNLYMVVMGMWLALEG